MPPRIITPIDGVLIAGRVIAPRVNDRLLFRLLIFLRRILCSFWFFD